MGTVCRPCLSFDGARMNKCKIVITVLMCCIMVTSNIVFVPQSFASESIVLEESSESEVTDEVQEPELIINAWDENGFYHDADGVIVKDKILSVDGKMYLFDKNGIAVLYTGNLKSSDGKTYYYKDGVKFTGNRIIDGKSFYYKNGCKFNGIRILNGKPYFYKNGRKSKTEIYIYNKKCYKYGKVYTGVYKSYYYNKGVKVTKHKNKVKKVSNGKFYYFKKNGTVYKGSGWKRVKGKLYYFKNGVGYTGWHYIGNYKYYFHKNTASLCQDLIACQGSKWKKKDLLIKVNRKKNIVTIYAKDGKNGYIIPVKALTCSVGKKETPTIKGTYIMKSGSGRTYRWHVLGGPALGLDYSYGQYCVRIYKSWLFHSVTYDKPDKYALQTETYNDLGKAASHGCIRLQVKDAKLIYDIVEYRDTKVKIFDSDWKGPFDKPEIKKIPIKQKYDPTDPFVKK